MKKKLPEVHPLTTAFEQSFNHSDGRVVMRRRDVLLFELSTIEEHLNGLNASVTEVLAKKVRLEARIAGLNNVIAKRA